MPIDDELAGRQAVAERLDAIFDEAERLNAAERAAFRETHAMLFAALDEARRTGDLSLAGKRCKQVAVQLEAIGRYGEAKSYRDQAQNHTNELRRRNWIERQKGKRR